MIEIALFVNLIALVSCGIAAGMNFYGGNTVTGFSMMALFIMNLGLFATNLWRLIG